MTSAPRTARRARTSAPPYPRIIIDEVRPVLNGGRHAIKRVVGDVLIVEATAFRDGHDLVLGRVRYRPPGERRWRTAPMTYDIDVDRLRGTIRLDRIGRWAFSVDAWTDRFGSWRKDTAKKIAAGQDVEVDLLRGAELIEEAARRARGALKARLRAVATGLRGAEEPAPERAAPALEPAFEAVMREALPPDDLVGNPSSFAVVVDEPIAAFAAWYEMFPRSQSRVPGKHGTFESAAAALGRVADLGFDVVYLPPIHPVGVTGRKGANNTLTPAPGDPGSPWAIGNRHGGHTAVEPKLGTIDDFDRFVARARELGLEVALDYALNCSPDHPWVREHPEWFVHRADGTIAYAENPPKKYEDIYPLNFWCEDYRNLWAACRDIFQFWIEHGVRIFRVDNPHTKPFAFWEWAIGELKRARPDVIFLSEAFTRPARMKGLAKLGFTQSYTYFTWRNTPWELREYLTELTQTPMTEYFRPNFFTNTPDILHEYLQTGGRPAFRIRLLLAATLSPLYGMYSGFELCENTPREPGSEEYLHSEKYQIRVRDWDAPGNINDDIRAINRLRREHPALQRLTNLRFHLSEQDLILFYHKHAPRDDLLIAVNLDPFTARDTMVHVPLEDLGLREDRAYEVRDLLTGAAYTWRGRRNYVRLDPREQPGHILRVSRPE